MEATNESVIKSSVSPGVYVYLLRQFGIRFQTAPWGTIVVRVWRRKKSLYLIAYQLYAIQREPYLLTELDYEKYMYSILGMGNMQIPTYLLKVLKQNPM